MIKRKFKATETTTFSMGRVVLVLVSGHDEYGLDASVARAEGGLIVHSFDHEPDGPSRQKLTPALWRDALEAGGGWYDDEDLAWSTVLRVEGDVYFIGLAFYRLAMDLDPTMDPANYTPGGDDDTFDYWPSGMRLLYQLAVDLDELTAPNGSRARGATTNHSGDRYVSRYREVLQRAVERNVPELEALPLWEELHETVTTEPYEQEED